MRDVGIVPWRQVDRTHAAMRFRQRVDFRVPAPFGATDGVFFFWDPWPDACTFTDVESKLARVNSTPIRS